MIKFNNSQNFMAEIVQVCKVQFVLFVQYAGEGIILNSTTPCPQLGVDKAPYRYVVLSSSAKDQIRAQHAESQSFSSND